VGVGSTFPSILPPPPPLRLVWGQFLSLYFLMLGKVRDICHTYFIDKERLMPSCLINYIKVNVRVRRNRFICLLLVHSHSVLYSVQCFVHKQRQLVPHESLNSIIMQLLDRFCAEWRFVESENFEEYLKGDF
jgi:hypothetical protein